MIKPAGQFSPLVETAAFRETLLAWFDQNGKSYPWRETRDPWAILVSEIMLQQTTVSAVLANRRFELFLEEFPDLQAIADAPESQLLRAWEGLGYYNRVRNLQKTARAVLSDHHGQFPKTAPELKKLPGIGPYTAGAVASFAFNTPAAIVDANVARVLARLFDDATAIDSTAGQKLLWQRAEALVDPQHARRFNSALMELGQTTCSLIKPACLTCPARDFCQTTNPESLPVKKPKTPVTKVTEHALWALRPDPDQPKDSPPTQILLAQEQGTRRKGLWHLPLRPAPEAAAFPKLSEHRYGITRYRVTLHLHQADWQKVTPQPNERWIPLRDLPSHPMPSPIRKILQSHL